MKFAHNMFCFFVVLMFLSVSAFSFEHKKVELCGALDEKSPKYITPCFMDKNIKSSKFMVYNPWEKREDLYEGILLDDFVKMFGSSDVSKLKLIALDFYEIIFDKELYQNERILLAYKVNGKYISIRERGPMRIVFVDYDASKKKYELNLVKWLWMIKKVEFIK